MATKPRLELVTWLDARLHADVEGPGKADLAIVYTAGWVIYADKQKIEVAAEYYVGDGTSEPAGEPTWRAVTTIPSGWVKKRRALK